MGSPEHASPDQSAPHHLGPYRLVSTLGSGGFGEVHLALDPHGHTVAVKVLHPHVASDAFALTRLAREVETMRRVRGRHVAEVLDASLTGDRPYIVTRYVQGRALSTVLAKDGPARDGDLVRLAAGLAEALESIHAAGVVHRDLKPANVIIADGEPYVIDFGIACALESASVTASGAVVGTPGYLAPEVLEGGDAGPEADVFAWAATVAFASSGRQPYGTGPAAAIAYRVVHREPDLSGVPAWLAPLLERCLRTDPAARPAADELTGRLHAAAPPGHERRDGQPGGQPDGQLDERSGGRWHDRRNGRDGRRRAGRGAPGRGAPMAGEPVPGVRASYADPLASRDPLPPGVPPADLDRPWQDEMTGAGGIDEAVTRQWRPGERRRPGPDARARHRQKVHRRWVIGSAVVVGLFAAAARHNLPEVSLLLLVLYGIALLIDAGFGLVARSRSRVAVDVVGGVGVVAVWALLSTLFSTGTLLLAVGTVLFLLVALVVAS
ncbi:serine/threonine-protein kinase [Microbispora sp. NPDC049125]|uniref:serine/threonine-protein kinase n=1 Tax=Microbispora sp. NPDC049125 TaxID=3154929 RepID=UPI0034676E07